VLNQSFDESAEGMKTGLYVFNFCYFLLWFICCLVVPFSAASKVRDEVGGGEYELISVTGISPSMLLLGKLQACFVQTIMLAAGDAGKRVEIGNVVDWKTKESNLKAVFQLTASNRMATYNNGIGTIQRPNAQPKKFEVLSHQWIDLTDISGVWGATILTDCKNGSDKPNDNTIRLTLIRTPGARGGYPDQATQDLGHHEFIYGLAGHADGWRDSQTDWQGVGQAQASGDDQPKVDFLVGIGDRSQRMRGKGRQGANFIQLLLADGLCGKGWTNKKVFDFREHRAFIPK